MSLEYKLIACALMVFLIAVALGWSFARIMKAISDEIFGGDL